MGVDEQAKKGRAAAGAAGDEGGHGRIVEAPCAPSRVAGRARVRSGSTPGMPADDRPRRVALPPYTVRRSERARHARLVVSGRDGLVVVVPTRFDLRRVPELVAARAEWIERSLRRVGGPVAPAVPGLPAVVELAALAERWQVAVGTATGRRITVEARAGVLLVPGGGRPGDPSADAAALEALRAWLSQRARATLEPWLRRLAAEQKLSVGTVTVRAQRTRWASCSARGNVSLNRTLLFLPPELVRHVLHHELAHRLELNHSPRFHAHLAAMDPDAAVHAATLRTAWRLVPLWAG